MISTLQSLQEKFKNDRAFKEQFEKDTNTPEINVDALGSNLLDFYYKKLQDLLANGHRRYPLYARVPFSEETFKIDTNTRAITIPKVFQTNGVGVVGDHLAEVLWFEMDRFYDLTDLMVTHISILWHNTGNKAADLAYETEPFALYCDDEKIYFGWWISQDAAAIAGKIEFAVQFLRTEDQANSGDQQVVFSLKTLPATLTIKNGLELTMPVEQETDTSYIVTHRAIYSEIVNTLAASEPIIYQPLPQGKFDLDIEGADAGKKRFMIRAASPDNLVTKTKKTDGEGHYLDENDEIVDSETEAADVYTLTEANHKGEIQFKWYWNNIPIDAPNGDNIKAKIAEDGQFHLDLVVEPYINIVTINEENAEDKICQSVLVTNIPGSYNAYVGNKIIKGDDIDSIRFVMTGTAVLEEATPITVKKNTNPRYMYIEDEDVLHTLVADLDWTGVNGTASYVVKANGELSDEQLVLAGDINKPITKKLEMPGEYQLIVYNTKNSMRQTDVSDIVTALHAPVAINDIDCIYSEVNRTVTVVIDEGTPTNDKIYQCRATIQKAPGGTVQNFALENTINNATFVINLNDRNLEPGHYFLTIFATQVTLHDQPNFTRYYRGADGKVEEKIATATFEIE